jgi:hypothetical protein
MKKKLFFSLGVVFILMAFTLGIAEIFKVPDVQARMNVMIVGGDPDSAAADYSDILFHWGADSGSGNLVTQKPSGGSALTFTNTGLTFPSSSPSAAVGTYSIGRTTANDRATVTLIEGTHITREAGQIAFWLQYNSGISAGSDVIEIVDDPCTGTNRIEIEFEDSSAQPNVLWTGNSAFTRLKSGASALSADTWYYVVAEWEPGAAGNDLFIGVYNSGGSLISSDTAASITAWSADCDGTNFTMIVGLNVADSQVFYFDNIITSNDGTRDMVAIRNVTDYN